MRGDIILPHDTVLENFKPISGFVVVKPAEKPKLMILRPEFLEHEGDRGTILLAADELDEELRPGQEVLFSPYAHRILELNGNYLFLVHSSDILARLEHGGGQ